MSHTSPNCGPYGVRRVFQTNAGNVIATTREDAKRRICEITGQEAEWVRGPKTTGSLKEMGIRGQIRAMNRRAA